MKIREMISGLLRQFTPTTRSPRNSHHSRAARARLEQLEDRCLLTTIDLATLTGAQGTIIYGAEFLDKSGVVTGVGDVNGDGFDDVLVGAPLADAADNGTYDAGESYLIFGGASLTATIDLANPGAAGVIIYGADIGDNSGFSVSRAGDFNGDGFGDLLIGARYADGAENAKLDAGESYIIFGGSSLPASINLADLGVSGIKISGANANDRSGFSVSNAGDMNGDGFDDVLIGAPFADPVDGIGNTTLNAGISYVIFGGVSVSPEIDLANLGTAGIAISGAASGGVSGYSVSAAGDFNGDGFSDIAIGSPQATDPENIRPASGASYVVFGGQGMSPAIGLANLGFAGLTIVGADGFDHSGISVSGAGDIDGDGFDDLIVGALGADSSGNAKAYAGESYVIYGAREWPVAFHTLDLAFTGSSHFRTIYGVEANDFSGSSVSAAGDVNGDGFDDLLIGSFRAAAEDNLKPYAGESYVMFGRANRGADLDLATRVTDSFFGMTIYGADANDQSGQFLSDAGDVNGDGIDDLVIGAYVAGAANNARFQGGESYVIFGSVFGLEPSHYAHFATPAGSVLAGTVATDVMTGNLGNDILIGGGGEDVLSGGHGDDILAVSDLTFRRIVGGSGNDTLRLDGGGQAFRLDSLADNRIQGIERIDITGSGNNTLTLNQLEVLNLSRESNTLLVLGDSFDQVHLDSGWLRGGDENIESVSYRVLTKGTATLKVAAAVRIQTTMIDLGNLGAAGITVLDSDNLNVWPSVSNAGDVNGDGFDDLLIGDSDADAVADSGQSEGVVYLIYGGDSLPSIDLANLGSAGVILKGADLGDGNGRSVSSAGDVNGDGFDDLLIGAPGADSSGNAKRYAGESYVIFGGESLPQSIELDNLGTAGMTIFGADSEDFSGFSVSSAGDVNGDGFDDLLIGAYGAEASENATYVAGESYVIFGSLSPPPIVDLADLGTAGVVIFGIDANDRSGRLVSNAGDVNGDGFDDLLIGAPFADGSSNATTYAGECYVIFGGPSLPRTIDLSNLGTAGVTIFGAEVGYAHVSSASSAGDVNGDGFDDLLMGAPSADVSESLHSIGEGKSYVIFGGASLPSTIDLGNLGTAGIAILGADSLDSSGFPVSGAGDVNGDGFDDLLIGATRADASGNFRKYAGETYVIFGSTSLPQTIELANLGTAGISIFGAKSFEYSGISISSAGDVNGDGFDDLLIGTRSLPSAFDSGMSRGKNYMIFGGDFTLSVTDAGTSSDETLTGTVGANIMIGDRGDDVLIGGGGADVLIGGQGNDLLAVSDLTFKRLVGGTGIDTLRLDGSGLSFNMAIIADNRILGVEQIDITGSGNNTLTLNYREVLNISDESNTLIVRRGLGDVVHMGGGWARNADQAIGTETFAVFTQGTAILLVQTIADSDGVSALIEDGAPNGGDGNYDEIPDSEQEFVASLPSEANGVYMTLVSASESRLVAVQALDNPSPENSPENVAFPFGFLNFRVDGVSVGGATTVTIHLDPSEANFPETYFKFGATQDNATPHWYEFLYDGSTGAVLSPENNTIVLHFVDGERGDDDLAANGIVVDPGGGGYFENQAPTAVTLLSVLDSIPENTNTTTAVKVADISVTDDAFGTNVLFLTGPAAGSFEIIGAELFLKAGVPLNFETLSLLSITVSVDDTTVGSTPDATTNYSLSIADVNEAPTITSALDASVGENQTAAIDINGADVDASTTLTYAISGADSALFDIDAATGVVTFKTAPNFEAPSDAGADNVYDFSVTVSDGELTATQAIAITVTNVNEVPTTLTLDNASIAENSAAGTNIGTFSSTDPDAAETFSYSLVAGFGDNASFQIIGNNLQTKDPLDFESKQDYLIRVRTTDASGLFIEQNFTVTVSDVNEGSFYSGTSGNDAFIVGIGATTISIRMGNVLIDTVDVGTSIRIDGLGGTDSIVVQDNTGLGNTLELQNAVLTMGTSVVSWGNMESSAVEGLAGNDTFIVSGAAGPIVLRGGNDNDTFVFGNGASLSVPIDGGSGTDRLLGSDANNTWLVNGTNAGTLSGVTTFTQVELLTGGAGDDTFRFVGTGALSGRIDGGAGVDVLDYSARTSGVTVNLATTTATGTGGIASIEAVIASSFATDLLIGRNVANTWRITGIGAGNLNAGEFGFTGFENLTGGSAFDRFVLATGGSVPGTINGGSSGAGERDQVSYEEITDPVVFDMSVAAKQLMGAMTGIEEVVGSSGLDTLQGANAVNTWSLTGQDTGTLGPLRFVGFENLVGGSLADSFSFVAGGSIQGIADGGGGTDTVLGSNSATNWQLQGAGQGTFNGGAFSGIENLTGGTAADVFLIESSGSLSGTLNGGSGIDRIDVADHGSDLQVSVSTTGRSIADVAGLFASVEHVQALTPGGHQLRSGAANTAWVINAAGQIVTGSVTYTGFGQIVGGSGIDTLTGPGLVTAWTIDSLNSGHLDADFGSGSSLISFSGVENVTGGTAADSFLFGSSGRLTGTLNGGGGIDRIEIADRGSVVEVSVSSTGRSIANVAGLFTGVEQVQALNAGGHALIGGAATTTWLINAGGQIVTGSVTYTGFGQIIGGSGTDTLTGPALPSTWTIDSPNSGYLGADFGFDSTAISFSGLENLTGGTAADQFYIAAGGSLSGTLNGGSGVDRIDIADRRSSLQVTTSATGRSIATVGREIMNVAGLFTGVEQVQALNAGGHALIGGAATTTWLINAAGQIVTGSVTYTGFDQIVGTSGTDTLTGPAIATVWTISGPNTGYLDFAFASFQFQGIENLTGGTAVDEFQLLPAGSLSGNLSGGTSASNAISYASWTNSVTVNLATGVAGNATAIGGILSNMSVVSGGDVNDTLIGNSSLPTVLIGHGGNDSLTGGAGRDILIGGWGADTIYGGAGEDILIGCTSAYDWDAASLLAVHTEWKNTARTFATRVNNLLGTGSGPRLNGDAFLDLNTVYSDFQTDTLRGDASSDWFWANASEVTDFLAFGTGADRRDNPGFNGTT